MRTIAVLLAALAATMSLGAQAATSTQGLDELLKQVREGQAQASRISQEREQRFLRDKNEQAALVTQAERELAAAKGAADAARAQFDAGQKAISELKSQLQTRAGDYLQVYAGVRQVAADFRAVAGESPLSAQYPERLAFLDHLAGSSELPGVQDLEELWFLLQQQITEGGRTARFNAEIVDGTGVRRAADVVRVGEFSVFAEDGYLAINPADGRLVSLPRQPDDSWLGLARDFLEADESPAPILIDPARGGLLTQMADRPTTKERVDQGGVIAYIIIVLGSVGTLLAVYQLAFLLHASVGVRRQLAGLASPRQDNPLGRVLSVLRDETSQDPELLELHLSEAVLRETPRLERFQSLLRMIIAAGPLLGLLGTVSGMIVTFQVITEVGSADPKAMAGGISQAMVTTLLGLGVAIPLLFINSLLSSRSRHIVQLLDEQAAGMMAQRLEQARGNA
ncbi:MAG: MotA/TolQ/ExbB proton channel family protein [Sinimarinibacterium sp.]|jgi:biopolymer transport protein ExbB